MNRSSATEPQSKFRVSRTSVRRRMWPDPETTVRVDLVFFTSESPARCVAVSVDPMVPNPGEGYKILSDDEICDWLQQAGFAIDEETQVPQPGRTVNAANPIPMFGGQSALQELLAQES